MTDRLKVAILGFGRSGGGMHAVAIQATGDFELAAVCDADAGNRRQAQDRFGCRVYEDHRRMLRDEPLDLVSIVTRSDQHCPMTCDCLAAGANVLVTKPWCLDQTEARQMLEAAEGSGRLLLPFLPARWGADFRRLREIVLSGGIGRVFCLRRFQSSFATRNDWQTQRRFGGGYLLNWGPHLVDTALGVVGGRARSAYGWMRQVINPGDVEDVFFAALVLQDGALVTAEYTVAAKGLPNWYVQGDRGTVVVEDRQVTMYSGRPHRPGDPTDYPAMAAAEAQVAGEVLQGELYGDAAEVYRAAADALRGREPFPVRPEEALELTRVLDAIRQSDLENQVVNL
jgi:predicted dehydrogenase